MLSRLRARTEPLAEALARPIVATGLNPNLLTVLGVPLSVTVGVLFAGGHPGLAVLLALPTALVDFVDGAVARLSRRTSSFGNLLDAVVDRVVEAALLVGMAPRFPMAACMAMGGCLIVSYIKARTGLVVVTDNRDWPGFADRTDRVVLIFLAMLMVALGSPALGELMLWLVASISLVGIVQRVLYARKLIDEAELLPYLQDQSNP